MSEVLAIALAYALGSIPSGYLAGRLRGIDIREVGSKNVGATNVFRSLGKGIGLAVMGVDIGKGIAAVALASALTDEPWPLLAAGAAIVGHVYPVWLSFRGGKGVAVTAGVTIGLMPLAAVVMIPVWIVIVAVTRYVSVASIAAAIGLTPVAWALGERWPTLIFAGLVSAAVLWRHRGNVARLRRGTELRLSFRKARA